MSNHSSNIDSLYIMYLGGNVTPKLQTLIENLSSGRRLYCSFLLLAYFQKLIKLIKNGESL